MQKKSPDQPHTCLSEALARFGKLGDEQSYSLREILQAIDEKGFGVFLVLLALPSALPFPAPAMSTPFGLAIVTLGVQMLMGKQIPGLPERALRIKFSSGLFKKIIGAATKFLGFAENFIRPRMRWVTQPKGRRFLSFLVILMGLLMCLPIPGTNTFPAMVVFLVGVCISEEDGFIAILAAFAGAFAVLVYLVAIFFLIRFFSEYGWDAIDVFLQHIKDFVKGLFGSEASSGGS
ncbi:MAG: exopolysaccharide biosynthesis protein [Verrucomicrobiota bacterium]